MTNIAIENCPFTDDVPIQTSIYSGFSIAMLNNQMVYPFIGSFPIRTSIYKGLPIAKFDCPRVTRIDQKTLSQPAFKVCVGEIPAGEQWCQCIWIDMVWFGRLNEELFGCAKTRHQVTNEDSRTQTWRTSGKAFLLLRTLYHLHPSSSIFQWFSEISHPICGVNSQKHPIQRHVWPFPHKKGSPPCTELARKVKQFMDKRWIVQTVVFCIFFGFTLYILWDIYYIYVYMRDYEGKAIVNYPQITMFTGGMFTISSHGWFMAWFYPQKILLVLILTLTCKDPWVERMIFGG